MFAIYVSSINCRISFNSRVLEIIIVLMITSFVVISKT